jgi:hypothetical protein
MPSNSKRNPEYAVWKGDNENYHHLQEQLQQRNTNFLAVLEFQLKA